MALAGGHLIPYCTYKATDTIVTLKGHYINIILIFKTIVDIILAGRVLVCGRQNLNLTSGIVQSDWLLYQNNVHYLFEHLWVRLGAQICQLQNHCLKPLIKQSLVDVECVEF